MAQGEMDQERGEIGNVKGQACRGEEWEEEDVLCK